MAGLQGLHLLPQELSGLSLLICTMLRVQAETLCLMSGCLRALWCPSCYMSHPSTAPCRCPSHITLAHSPAVAQQTTLLGQGLHTALYLNRMSAQALGDVFSAFAAALGAADKVIELIQRLPDMPDPGRLQPDSFSGHLELKDVEFSYPSRPDTRVLNGVSLSVAPGEASRQPYPSTCS